MSSGERVEGQNTRWWESYLVRYFLGFIVGTVCVAIFLGNIFPCSAPAVLGATATLFSPTKAVQKACAERARDAKLVIDDVDKVNSQSTSDSEQSSSSASNSSKPTAETPDKAKENTSTPMAIAIALMGMAYCYIASTPITVIHAGRMYRSWAERQTRTFWLGWAGVLGVSIFMHLESIPVGCNIFLFLAGIGMCYVVDPYEFERADKETTDQAEVKPQKICLIPRLWAPIDPTNKARQGRTVTGLIVNAIAWAFIVLSIAAGIRTQASKPDDLPIVMLLLALPVIWICIAQYVVLFQIMTKSTDFTTWYQKVVRARTTYESTDVRESYTHLREHANSIFIVVIEVCLLLLLLCLPHFKGPVAGSTQVDSDGYILSAAAILAIWLVPTIFMWSRANWLEQEFADTPKKFAKKRRPSPSNNQTPK